MLSENTSRLPRGLAVYGHIEKQSPNQFWAAGLLAGFFGFGMANLLTEFDPLLAATNATGGVCSQLGWGVLTVDEDWPALEAQVIRNAWREASRSVVRLEWVGGRNLLWEEMPGGAAATGTVISQDGLVVTSTYFFLDRPSAILVGFADGQVVPGRMLGRDFNRMITVIKVNRDCTSFLPRFCSQPEIEVGMRTIAIGWTLGDEPDLAVGILSAKRRIWGKAFQTDARTSPRNYGGPLVDLRGRILGVIVPFSPDGKSPVAGVEWYDSGIGFAVPWWDIQAVLPRLATGEDLHPAFLGAVFSGVNPILAEPVVTRVHPGSPAEQLGLQPRDRIVSLDNQDITRLSEIEEILQRRYAGEEIPVQWVRDGNRFQGTVRLGVDRRVLQAGAVGPAP